MIIPVDYYFVPVPFRGTYEDLKQHLHLYYIIDEQTRKTIQNFRSHFSYNYKASYKIIVSIDHLLELHNPLATHYIFNVIAFSFRKRGMYYGPMYALWKYYLEMLIYHLPDVKYTHTNGLMAQIFGRFLEKKPDPVTFSKRGWMFVDHDETILDDCEDIIEDYCSLSMFSFDEVMAMLQSTLHLPYNEELMLNLRQRVRDARKMFNESMSFNPAFEVIQIDPFEWVEELFSEDDYHNLHRIAASVYHHFTGKWEIPDAKILQLFFAACLDMFRICNGEHAQDKLLFSVIKFSDPFTEIKNECFVIIQSYSQYPRRAAFPLQCHQIWETMVGRIHLTINPVKESDTLKI